MKPAYKKRTIPSIRHGFSLTEVMVVIGILGILTAIVVPVANHARENGRRATCQSNLRQIAAAMQQYVQENDGVYPVAIPQDTVGSPKLLVSWQTSISPYLKSRDVFRCIDHPTELFGDENYTFNIRRLNTIIPKRPKAIISGTHESRLPHSSTTWLNTDAKLLTSDGVCHFCREVPKSSCDRQFFGSTIHGGGGNYSFLDGHVKWFLPEAMAEVECQNGPMPFPFRD